MVLNFTQSTPQIVDKFISAELPNSEEDPILYDIASKNMIHGPCDQRCIENGKCFPKEFRDETIMNTKGYPYYRRRNNGQKLARLGRVIDNRYVVPY